MGFATFAEQTTKEWNGVENPVVVNVPAGVQDGDVLFFWFLADGAGPLSIDTTGWGLGGSSWGGSGIHGQRLEKEASSEPASYSFTLNDGGVGLDSMVVVCQRWQKPTAVWSVGPMFGAQEQQIFVPPFNYEIDEVAVDKTAIYVVYATPGPGDIGNIGSMQITETGNPASNTRLESNRGPHRIMLLDYRMPTPPTTRSLELVPTVTEIPSFFVNRAGFSVEGTAEVEQEVMSDEDFDLSLMDAGWKELPFIVKLPQIPQRA